MRYALVLALFGLLAGTLAHSQNIPPADQQEGPHDRRIPGPWSPYRIASEIEAQAREDGDAGKSPFKRGSKFRFTVGDNRAESEALGRHAVFLILIWTQKAEELPVRRVFIRANGQEIPIEQVSNWQTDVDKTSLTAKMYGPYREDGFYLVPLGSLLRNGQLTVDLTANGTGWVMLQLPSRVVTPEKYPNPDPPPGAKPDLKTLQAVIRRKFPGFPVPLALP